MDRNQTAGVTLTEKDTYGGGGGEKNNIMIDITEFSLNNRLEGKCVRQKWFLMSNKKSFLIENSVELITI